MRLDQVPALGNLPHAGEIRRYMCNALGYIQRVAIDTPKGGAERAEVVREFLRACDTILDEIVPTETQPVDEV